jgi:hypothetical protein
MRIIAGEELEKQLIQIETADERKAFEGRVAALPFSLMQGAQLGLAGPRQQQRLKGKQHAAQRRSRAARAARDQCHSSHVACEGLYDETGLTEWIAVQHETGLLLLA